jgi:hypothetical protein
MPPDVPDDVEPAECDGVGVLDTTGELTTGAELWVDGEDTGVVATDELDAADVVGFAFGFFGFGGGAWSAGTAAALANGVIVACCAPAELDCASDPAGAAGADDFLTADPMANAATSPTTSARPSSSQRLRTS